MELKIGPRMESRQRAVTRDVQFSALAKLVHSSQASIMKLDTYKGTSRQMHFRSLNHAVSLNPRGLSLCLWMKQRPHLRHIYHKLIFACNIGPRLSQLLGQLLVSSSTWPSGAVHPSNKEGIIYQGICRSWLLCKWELRAD